MKKLYSFSFVLLFSLIQGNTFAQIYTPIYASNNTISGQSFYTDFRKDYVTETGFSHYGESFGSPYIEFTFGDPFANSQMYYGSIVSRDLNLDYQGYDSLRLHIGMYHDNSTLGLESDYYLLNSYDGTNWDTLYSIRSDSFDLFFMTPTTIGSYFKMIATGYLDMNQTVTTRFTGFFIDGYWSGLTIEEENDRSKVDILPQYNGLQIIPNNKGLVNITIIDLTGRVVLKDRISSNTSYTLNQGLYIIELSENNKAQDVRKIMVY